jgi:ATP-dependent RNA helicase DDX5/DBP2
LRRTQAEVEAFRLAAEMSVIGRDVPRPIQSFEEAPFPEYIKSVLGKQGFVKPTPIQAQGWPMALSGV